MNEDVIFRYKNGHIIPIKVKTDQTTNQYMNDFLRNRNKPKKVNYQKYMETRKKSIDAFIAINGKVEMLSEAKANELLALGVPEELLPYAYPLKDEYNIQEQIKAIGKDEWLKRYIEQAERTREKDKEYQMERQEWQQFDENRTKVEEILDNSNYDGKGSKQFKDYETEEATYKIDPNTLKTITNDWGYKDSTRNYFEKLDDKTKKAIEDYTSQTEHYNYAYYNNILNDRWKDKKLDGEASKRIKLIDNAINNSTIDENMYVYRASDLAFSNDKGIIMSKGYTSTSLYNEVKNYTDSPDVLKIRVPKGTKGLYIGGNTMSWMQENEVLLGRNTKIQILGRNNDGTIECTIIQ